MWIASRDVNSTDLSHLRDNRGVGQIITATILQARDRLRH